jgi:hypothetical protein
MTRVIDPHPNDTINSLRAEVERLTAENASLASWQCEFTDGKTGLVYSEGGGTYCAMAKENEKLRAALKKIAKVTYGSDWTWGSEELADYYSMRFFNAQETARAALGEEKKG